MLTVNDSILASTFEPAGWNQTIEGVMFGGGEQSGVLQLHVSDGQGYGDGGVVLNDFTILSAGANFQGNTVPPNVGQTPEFGTPEGGLWDIRDLTIPRSALNTGANTLTLTSGVASDCLSLVVMLVSVPHVQSTLQFGEWQMASSQFDLDGTAVALASGTIVNGTNVVQEQVSVQYHITQGTTTAPASGWLVVPQGWSENEAELGVVPAASTLVLDTRYHSANTGAENPFVEGPAILTVQLRQGDGPVLDTRSFEITLFARDHAPDRER
jgi:hypothetical protein